MKFPTISFCAFVILSIPMVSFAGPIVRSGNSVSVSSEQVLENDFYGFARDITISGEAKEDVYVVGNTVTVNAPVAGDMTTLGATIQIHAPVSDDVRIVGGAVHLASKVSGDVVVLGGSLKILSTAEIGGDILFLGGYLDVEGPVTGSIYGRADTVRIDTAVAGDVRVRATQRFTLGDKADVSGSVTYASAIDIERAQNAVVGGAITKENTLDVPDSQPMTQVLPLIMQLFTALALFMLFRERIQTLTTSVGVRYGMFGLTGLGILFGVPLFAAILMVSVVGVVIGIALMLAYILFLITAWSLTGVVCGTLILRPLTKTDRVTFLSAVVGTLLFVATFFVPFLGLFIALTAFLIVLGGLGTRLYYAIK